MASVKVAVRVRPMNKREKDMEAQCIIEMDGSKTTIYATPNKQTGKKDFTFDHSYWSMNSSDPHFASQEMVFKDLGVDVIDAAFEGYNACIFAYGQTGAGKSYSMMGAKDAPGLIPRICEGLYERMNVNPTDKIEYRTEVSYLEIYNEHVADLLRPPGKNKDNYHSLKVREHPKEGPYVQELTKHMVKDYQGIEALMEIGNNHRTVASTNMNDVSSRSHAIFTITFTQAKFFTDMPSETLSRINLVDLAGSERADSTGATGNRLKEGANINKSLVTLGTVISALAEASQAASDKAGKKQLFIPYRNSTLTWLLKDSLGGNSKTIMIAAISPADVNHPETLSTLRYANRAKNIVNKPTVNEDPNVRLIRELRAEIEQLRNLLKDRPEILSPDSESNEESTRLLMAEKLHENEVKVEELTRSWTSRWKETQKILEEKALSFRNDGLGVKLESELPHLVCMDNDLLSTAVTLYHLKDGMTHLGRADARTNQDIILHGPGIVSEHCILECIDINTILHPLGPMCAVNGEIVTKPVKLKQGDVMLLGKTNMFRFNHPAQAAKLREKRIYASVENLAELGESDNERPPSYLFYNAGLELERQYMEETKRLDQMRHELEKQQAEAKSRLSEARDELESIQEQQREAEITRQARDEQRKREIEERQKKLEQQEKYLEELKHEQEKAREQAEKEIADVKVAVAQEQEEERQKLNEEMKRIAELEEKQRKIVEDKEMEIKKIKSELARKWEEERKQVEQQRKEVEKLQRDFEEKRKSFHLEVEVMQQRSKSVPDLPKEIEKEKPAREADSPHIEMQRERLKRLEDEYEEERLIAQREIANAREGVRCAEQETLHGVRSLTSGKTLIEDQWARLEHIQHKHKKVQEEMINKIKDTRERLDIAEEAEEAALIEKERVIMERRATRMKVEEAKRKLQELESEGKHVELSEADFTKKKESLEMETREEVKDIREERRILMELLGKHQSALAKATQMVTETKTKLEKHLENEKLVVIPQRDKVENLVRHELGPLIDSEQDIERRCEEADRESRERKKVIYKQRRRIALLERQHNQSLQQAEKETLNKEELEELENEREAEKSLIRKEKVRLLELEKWHKEQQEIAELTIGELVQELEKRKEIVNERLEQERMKLQEIESVHKETLEHVEAELENRTEILHRVKDKVLADKRQLAKLDLRQQRCATKAAEELFLVIDVLEKEMEDKGKMDELQKIRDHRKKLQDLDRQMRWADRKERQLRGGDDGGPCTLY